MTWLGDFPATFTAVPIFFTTHAATGAPVAPNSAFEAADVRLYKDGSATQRTSESGWTMTSPFDSITGLHRLLIDLTDNTDAGFYAAGHVYTAVLSPDETVDSLAVVKVIGQFGIGLTATTPVTLTNAQGYKKNTAVSKFVFPMFDLSLNPLTGLSSFTSEVSIDGAAFGAITDSVTEIGNGWYQLDLTAGEMNGDEIALRFSASGARETTAKIRTVQA